MDIIEKVAENSAKIEAVEKRVETCEKTIDAINNLSQSIVRMDTTLTNTNEAVKELKSDVTALKEEPKKKWNTIITKIIEALVTLIVGAVFGALITLL